MFALNGRAIKHAYKKTQRFLMNLNLFIIPSVIFTVNKPLSYYHIRSSFTPEERYQQTLDQIESVRQKVPNSYIVMVEASNIPHDMETVFRSKVDHYFNISDIPDVAAATNGPAKGHGEVMQMLAYLETDHFKNIRDKCMSVTKFCGRNKLADDYTFSVPDAPRIRLNTPDSMNTILFTFPTNYTDSYVTALKECLTDPDFIVGKDHASIEHKLYQIWFGTHGHKCIIVDHVGVQGFNAPWGTFYHI
jgi:hypothetical protein